MVPTVRLIWLILLGAPLWLLALAAPGGWLAGAAYFAWLAGMCGLNWLTVPRPGQLVAVRSLPSRFSMDDEHEIALELTNSTARRLRVRVHDELPAALEALDPDLTGELPGHGRARLTYRVRAVRRGAHAFGRLVLRVSHGAALVERQLALAVPDTARIYPRFHGVDDYRLLALIDQRDEVVRRPRRLRGAGTDFESLRPYLPGEDLRSVDWKASARRGTLIARNMQVERNQQIAVLIDVGRLMGETISGSGGAVPGRPVRRPLPKLEHAMNAAVMLAYVAQSRGDGFAALCFSNQIESVLAPVRGLSIMPRVLESLYTVQLRPVESDYWQVIAEATSALRRRSLVIMLTDVLDASGSAGLINNLARTVRRHVVLCVVMTEPRVRQAAAAVPGNAADAWRQAAACDLLRRRRLALEHMRSRGIMVMETDPDHLSIHPVQRYLDIRQAGML